MDTKGCWPPCSPNAHESNGLIVPSSIRRLLEQVLFGSSSSAVRESISPCILRENGASSKDRIPQAVLLWDTARLGAPEVGGEKVRAV